MAGGSEALSDRLDTEGGRGREDAEHRELRTCVADGGQ